jgi:recombination protein RecT
MGEERTAVAKRPETPLAKVRSLLNEDAYKRRFESVLKDRAPQFMASITNLVAAERQLQKCRPESIIAAAFVAACLDLPVDKSLGYAWIVPYGDMATFIIGWKGYVQLALRTGLYKAINAFPVNIEALGPFDEVGERQIYFDKLDTTKPAVGYCCAWKLTTGFVKVCYWSKEEVDAHAAKYSAAVKAKKINSPWFTETDKMRLKTVVANSLRKWGIMSIETHQMQMAVQHDQGAQEYIDAEVAYPDNDQLEPGEIPMNGKEAADQLAQRLKAEREANGTVAENAASNEPQNTATQPAAGSQAEESPPDEGKGQEAAQSQPEGNGATTGPIGDDFLEKQKSGLADAFEALKDLKGKNTAQDELEASTGTRVLSKVPPEKYGAGIAALNARRMAK